jgi:hypothetical protein
MFANGVHVHSCLPIPFDLVGRSVQARAPRLRWIRRRDELAGGESRGGPFDTKKMRRGELVPRDVARDDRRSMNWMTLASGPRPR